MGTPGDSATPAAQVVAECLDDLVEPIAGAGIDAQTDLGRTPDKPSARDHER